MTRSGKEWKFEEDFFLGMPVSGIEVDPRTDTWWVSLAHKHWGQKIHFSNNRGKTWEEVPAPRYPENEEVSPGVPATLKYIWSLAAAGPDLPDQLLVGTEPGGLFKSTDNGKSFHLVESLWHHPSRPEHWFGGGRNHAGIHSIVFDPRDSRHFYVGISCAGVFETDDGGETWNVRNRGLRADYLPDPFPEVGHDPHMLKICRTDPNIIWQQNHCGIFRSHDAGKSWKDVSQGAVNYGFALAVDNDDPNRAWVVPATSDQVRVAVDKALAVYRTDNGGKTWRDFREGLPQKNAYDIVLRHALERKNGELIFGTTTGNLYHSVNEGEAWSAISNNLPTVFCLKLV